MNIQIEKQKQYYFLGPFYMIEHQEINHFMRNILIDWMLDVNDSYNLPKLVVSYAVNYLDRFLHLNPNLQITKLQLVGATCLLIAIKFDQDRLNKDLLKLLVQSALGLYKQEDLRRTERLILKTLNYQLYVPTSLVFIDSCVSYLQDIQDKCNIESLRTMILFLHDVSLVHIEFLQFAPFEIAATILYIAFFVLKSNQINHVYSITGYKIEDLKNCSDYFFAKLSQPPIQQNYLYMTKCYQQLLPYFVFLNSPINTSPILN